MSVNDGTNSAAKTSWDPMRLLGTILVVLIAAAIAYVTFLGLINSQVNASNNPGNSSAPVIDYGE